MSAIHYTKGQPGEYVRIIAGLQPWILIPAAGYEVGDVVGIQDDAEDRHTYARIVSVFTGRGIEPGFNLLTLKPARGGNY